jgi:hypothetical protein
MKKIISLILVALTACLAFASCGTTAQTTEPVGTTAAPDVTDAPIGDITVPGGEADPAFGLDGETPTAIENFKYKVLADGTVSITGVYAAAADLTKIVLPAVIDGKKVSTLGESALATLYSLEEVVVSGYVVKIDPYAFRDCTALKTVKLSAVVVKLGEGVFSGCKALASTEFLPNSVKSVGARCFENCETLTKGYLPDSVTTIGERTFQGCGKMTEFKFPANITKIPERMFQGCSKLEKTTGCGDTPAIIIPEGVKEIGLFAFYECQQFDTLQLPSTLQKIGKQAFDSCRRLETLVVPDAVTSIGDNAFNTCGKLTTVTLPANVKLGKDVFVGSKKIEVFNVKAGSEAEAYVNAWKVTVDGYIANKEKGWKSPTINVQ